MHHHFFQWDDKVGLKQSAQESQRALESFSYQQHVIIKRITSGLHQADNWQSQEIKTRDAEQEKEEKKR